MNRGAIILCGGRSARMGRDKATLPFGPNEVLLQRVVRIVGDVVPTERIMCVAAEGQVVPALPERVRVMRDAYPQAGPLGGLATGLATIGTEVDAVFACGCDAPLVVPTFIERLFELLGERQVVIPREGEQLHPLSAVYRCNVWPIAESLLATGERSLRTLVARCDARLVDAEELRDVDQQLLSLTACNTDEEYRVLLARINPIA